MAMAGSVSRNAMAGIVALTQSTGTSIVQGNGAEADDIMARRGSADGFREAGFAPASCGPPPWRWVPGFGQAAFFAYSFIPWKSTITTVSFPTTQASCPDGRTDTSPGLQMNSVPSSITTFRVPEM